MVEILLFNLMAYLVGSLSSAVIVCKLTGFPDPRTTGSKNPGATNVLRLGNKKAAIATLLGDVLKGVLPVWAAIKIDPSPVVTGSVLVAVVIGHLYPIFFGFKGGKGVATALGALLALSWPVGFLCIGTWGIVAAYFRISSLAALVTALLAPLYTAWWLNVQFAIPVLVIGVLLFWRHRQNIKRLWQGIEPKIGKK